MSDDEVGYGKPPKQTQFKPGRSGNPRGRPKGIRNFKTDVKATLKAPIKVNKDGKARTVSAQEAALLRLMEMALKGNPRLLVQLLALAEKHNDEEVTTDSAKSLSAEDAQILEVYRARLNVPPSEPENEAGDAKKEDGGSK